MLSYTVNPDIALIDEDRVFAVLKITWVVKQRSNKLLVSFNYMIESFKL